MTGKRFCINGHDVLIEGRTSANRCRKCRSDFEAERRRARSAAKRRSGGKGEREWSEAVLCQFIDEMFAQFLCRGDHEVVPHASPDLPRELAPFVNTAGLLMDHPEKHGKDVYAAVYQAKADALDQAESLYYSGELVVRLKAPRTDEQAMQRSRSLAKKRQRMELTFELIPVDRDAQDATLRSYNGAELDPVYNLAGLIRRWGQRPWPGGEAYPWVGDLQTIDA